MRIVTLLALWLCCAAPVAAPGGANAEAAGPDDCLGAPYDTAGSPAQQAIAELLGAFRLHGGAYPSLAATLDRIGPEICLVSGVSGARGYFDLATNVIAIHAELTRGQQLAILIHELRHLDQVDRGVCPSDELAMREVARATFAMEADASAVAAHVGWEMRSAGDGDAWEALLAFPNYGDIAEAYAVERVASGSVPRALGRAFSQWYESEWRLDRYYLTSCSDYLDRMDAAHSLPSYQQLDAEFYALLCRLPDGTPYDCVAPEAPR